MDIGCVDGAEHRLPTGRLEQAIDDRIQRITDLIQTSQCRDGALSNATLLIAKRLDELHTSAITEFKVAACSVGRARIEAMIVALAGTNPDAAKVKKQTKTLLDLQRKVGATRKVAIFCAYPYTGTRVYLNGDLQKIRGRDRFPKGEVRQIELNLLPGDRVIIGQDGQGYSWRGFELSTTAACWASVDGKALPASSWAYFDHEDATSSRPEPRIAAVCDPKPMNKKLLENDGKTPAEIAAVQARFMITKQNGIYVYSTNHDAIEDEFTKLKQPHHWLGSPVNHAVFGFEVPDYTHRR